MSNPRRNALGRGLSALLENAATDFNTTESKPVNSINEILISQVEANPFQPRTEFEVKAFLCLVHESPRCSWIQRLSGHILQLNRLLLCEQMPLPGHCLQKY